MRYLNLPGLIILSRQVEWEMSRLEKEAKSPKKCDTTRKSSFRNQGHKQGKQLE